jgi:hypothetical protein
MTLRALIAILSVAVLGFVAGCSAPARQPKPYGASTAKLGESIAVLGWNLSLSNLRFESDYVLVDVDGAPSEQGKPHAKPEDIGSACMERSRTRSRPMGWAAAAASHR